MKSEKTGRHIAVSAGFLEQRHSISLETRAADQEKQPRPCPFPQKVGSKPQRRERIYKRTAKAQRDFLREGAVLLPGGERPAPTEPAGETTPNGVAAIFKMKIAVSHKDSPRSGFG